MERNDTGYFLFSDFSLYFFLLNKNLLLGYIYICTVCTLFSIFITFFTVDLSVYVMTGR